MNEVIVGQSPSGVGFSLFAARPFDPGEVVAEVRGRLLPWTELLSSGDADQQGIALQVAPEFYVLPADPIAFLNHRCDGNVWFDGASVIAIHAIKRGEELLLDYATASEDGWTLRCRCASSACRQQIGDFSMLPLQRQQELLGEGLVPAWLVRHLRDRNAAVTAPLQEARFKRLTIGDQWHYSALLGGADPPGEVWMSNVLATVESPMACRFDGGVCLRSETFGAADPDSYYTFWGCSKPAEAAIHLLSLARREYSAARICVAADSFGAGTLDRLPAGVHVRPLSARADFILSTEVICEGRTASVRRRLSEARRFCEQHPASRFEHLDLRQREQPLRILRLFDRWSVDRAFDEPVVRCLRRALERLLRLERHFVLLVGGVLIGEELVGLSITELGASLALNHVMFGLRVPGLAAFLMRSTSESLQAYGCKTFNYQDAGAPGLLQAKRSWSPVSLREYLELTMTDVDSGT